MKTPNITLTSTQGWDYETISKICESVKLVSSFRISKVKTGFSLFKYKLILELEEKQA